MLNQQNTSLSHGNAETDGSTTGFRDFIQDEKKSQTEKERYKKELQTKEGKEGGREDKLLTESRLNEKVETNKEKGNHRIEKEDGLSVSEVPPFFQSTSRQDHELPLPRY